MAMAMAKALALAMAMAMSMAIAMAMDIAGKGFGPSPRGPTLDFEGFGDPSRTKRRRPQGKNFCKNPGNPSPPPAPRAKKNANAVFGAENSLGGDPCGPGLLGDGGFPGGDILGLRLYTKQNAGG